VANFSRYPLNSDGNIVLFGGGEIVCGRRCGKKSRRIMDRTRAFNCCTHYADPANLLNFVVSAVCTALKYFP